MLHTVIHGVWMAVLVAEKEGGGSDGRPGLTSEQEFNSSLQNCFKIGVGVCWASIFGGASASWHSLQFRQNTITLKFFLSNSQFYITLDYVERLTTVQCEKWHY